MDETELRRFATLGAAVRLNVLQQEIDGIERAFPDLKGRPAARGRPRAKGTRPLSGAGAPPRLDSVAACEGRGGTRRERVHGLADWVRRAIEDDLQGAFRVAHVIAALHRRQPQEMSSVAYNTVARVVRLLAEEGRICCVVARGRGGRSDPTLYERPRVDSASAVSDPVVVPAGGVEAAALRMLP